MSGRKLIKGFLTRREFLVGAGAFAATAGLCSWWQQRNPKIPGQILGANATMGHRLRRMDFPTVSESKQVRTLIVGGGIAGLSAAWWLERSGDSNFLLIDLDQKVGGNSQSGQSQVSPYPWGAHYLPVPGKAAIEVKELLQDLGLIRGYDKSGQPLYDEAAVCHDPVDRLYLYGRWQSGVIPRAGLPEKTHREIDRFMHKMDQISTEKGNDGRYHFEIPIARSSRDPKYRNLDQITMAEYLQRNGFEDEYLLWYVNYCCRDDFGIPAAETSAWMGLHYFCSRRGFGGNVDSDSVLTWPAGNGWLVQRLTEKFQENIQNNQLAYKVTQTQQEVQCLVYDPGQGASIEYRCNNLILCTPRMVTERLIDDLDSSQEIDYGPWMVANMSLKEKPPERDQPLSWDNVLYNSESLGYVVATHQELHPLNPKSQWTYYWPLTHLPPPEARKWAFQKTHAEWVDLVLKDLRKAHPDIEEQIDRMDIWLWGHAMLRPVPGTVWGTQRKTWQESFGRIHFAHSDLSGYSIFEEAQYWGVEAARKVLGLQHDS